ncbi:P-loop containing nucleoside triphosphate hydrolase protein [Chiua virens]|nr:P-loop containing nucleoside triphosphate hydrolase protein [Chiua virens]
MESLLDPSVTADEFLAFSLKMTGSSASQNDPRDHELEVLIKSILEQSGEDGVQRRELGVMFRDLRVVGLGVGAAVQNNLASPFSPKSIISTIKNLRHPPVRDIISGFGGVVLPGEMLLVLGRPGSGCSTFLKTLANHRREYHDILGEVFYDSFTPDEINQRHRGDVMYCPEEDAAYGITRTRKSYATHMTEVLMHVFGLERARDTLIGDAFIRGISGGEKKRVSIAETLSARGKLVCWDNSTRGLDSSTALEFIRALRIATDMAKMTTVVSIYQAGEQLFKLFDKVCLIYEGKMVYFGPAKEAKRYFMNMGYEPLGRQTTPDFLVASTDPNGRKFRSEFKGVVPRTADEMAAYFRESNFGQLNRWSIYSYYHLYVNKPDLKNAYEMSVTSERAQHAQKSQSYSLSIPMQVRAVMRRRGQVLKGERATQVVQACGQIFQAIIVGTVFLQIANNTSTYFSRGSVLFFALFCVAMSSMAEIPGLFSQRAVVYRHQKAAFYYPFIESLAHTIVDIPFSLICTVIVTLVLYFLVGLQQSLGQYNTFFIFAFLITLVMKACFRSIAAFSGSESTAIVAAGILTQFLILFSGFTIPATNIIGPLSWLTYINPFRYAFESLIVNEFNTVDATCTTLVPQGPGYENATLANQACIVIGSPPGIATVPGKTYTYLTFGYKWSHLWRNFGILCVFHLGFLGLYLCFTQYNNRIARGTTVTLYKKGRHRTHVRQSRDEETGTPGYFHERDEGLDISDDDIANLRRTHTNIFSWQNVEYEVPVSKRKTRKLLDNVSGYVAPGKLTALMGASGAGKTTLLNVLAQRASVGIVKGDFSVNGQPLPESFQAQTAYVQQMDTHVPETTVREALLFSANLRQPASVPIAEKEADVDKCLKICGLEAYADAIVGSLGVEYRKRTTIGVELAAKPKLLLVLDEPTSGLDSQSAWAIVSFLRELADNGQAILCTIHQPSAELFQLFDRLLLLRTGGQTVYFGDIGEKSMTVIDYFQRNGAPHCAENANPAEYMLDVIGAGATARCTTDWHQIWMHSEEAAQLYDETQRIEQEGRSRPVVSTETHSEFATPWTKQLDLLIRRGFLCHWRNPAYIYSKLVFCVASGLIIGFTFHGSSNSLQGCQNQLFSVFSALTTCIGLGQQLQGKFMESKIVYEVRERPSRMFSWTGVPRVPDSDRNPVEHSWRFLVFLLLVLAVGLRHFARRLLVPLSLCSLPSILHHLWAGYCGDLSQRYRCICDVQYLILILNYVFWGSTEVLSFGVVEMDVSCFSFYIFR